MEKKCPTRPLTWQVAKEIGGYNTSFSDSRDVNCGHGLDIDRENWQDGYDLIHEKLTVHFS